MADWGAGSYEFLAAEIEPIASLVIDAVEPVDAPERGERLVGPPHPG